MKRKIIVIAAAIAVSVGIGYTGYVLGGNGQTQYIITPCDCGVVDQQVDVLSQQNTKMAQQIDSLHAEIIELYAIMFESIEESTIKCNY